MNVIEDYLNVPWSIQSPSGYPELTYCHGGLSCYFKSPDVYINIHLHKRRRDVRKKSLPIKRYEQLVSNCGIMAPYHCNKWRLDKKKTAQFAKSYQTSDKMVWLSLSIPLQDPNCKEKFWALVNTLEELYN